MAQTPDILAKFKAHIITTLIGLATTAMVGGVYAGYEWGKNLAQRQWVIDHVATEFERADARQALIEQIRTLRGIKEKASNPEVVADLERQIAELEARLEG